MAGGENNTARAARDPEAALAIERRADVIWDLVFKIKEALGKPDVVISVDVPAEYHDVVGDVMNILLRPGLVFWIDAGDAFTRMEICWRGDPLPARRVGEKR